LAQTNVKEDRRKSNTIIKIKSSIIYNLYAS
jgi:hypothetical protein